MVIRRISILLLVLILACNGIAAADIEWPEETNGQKVLKQYIESVNSYLAQQDEMPVNRCFEIHRSIAILGITAEDDAEIPEDIEINVRMNDDSLDSLELIVRNVHRFPAIATAFLRALFQDSETSSREIEVPAQKAAQALQNPDTSFGEEIYNDKGNAPRIYYNYYPDYLYMEKWIIMTIIFPMKDAWDGSDILTIRDEEKVYIPDEEIGEAYEGYYSKDDYSHFDVFTTPTPEPDSAAAEYDFR
jgi:hypothetical protein